MENVAWLSCYIGWETVLHYGSLIGQYSLLTLLPELHIGVFSSYNGAIQSDPFTINSLLHVHLIDLFIGVQPSIDNISHWCSLLDYAHQPRPHLNETASLLYPASTYVGVYWNAVLGEFEVWDNGTGTLMTRYGSLEMRLQPLQYGLEFAGVPTDPAWSMLFIRNISVQFAAVNGDQRCRTVRVELLQFTTFERREEDRSAAASGLPRAVTATTSCSSATALAFTIIITLMLHHCA